MSFLKALNKHVMHIMWKTMTNNKQVNCVYLTCRMVHLPSHLVILPSLPPHHVKWDVNIVYVKIWMDRIRFLHFHNNMTILFNCHIKRLFFFFFWRMIRFVLIASDRYRKIRSSEWMDDLILDWLVTWYIFKILFKKIKPWNIINIAYEERNWTFFNFGK